MVSQVKANKAIFMIILIIVAILDTFAFLFTEWSFEFNLGRSGLSFGSYLATRSLIDWIGNIIIACIFGIIVAGVIYSFIQLASSLHDTDEKASYTCLTIAGFIFGFMIAFGLIFAFGFMFLNSRDITGVDIIPNDFVLTIIIWGLNISFLLAGIFTLILYVVDPF